MVTRVHTRFSLYVPDYSSDIPLSSSQGVFVLAGTAGTWTPGGAPYGAGQPMTLQPGWNLVAAPFPSSGLDEAAIASELSSTCNPQEIATYSNGAYQTYIPGGSGSITVLATAGMWIDCANSASWTPTGSYTPPTTRSITYGYDADGARTSMTDATGTTSYSYDSLERLTSVTNGANQQAGYGYDNAGNITSITYPGSLQVTRGYDADNRLSSVKDWLGNTTSFGYDLDDNLTSETYPNGTSAALTYNDADQLMQIVDSTGSTPFWTFSETRNTLGQLATHADPIDTLSHTYGYNQLNQLTSDATSADTANWSYDGAGQLTGMSDATAGTSSTLSYDPAGQLSSLLTTASDGTPTQGLSYAYDRAGNRLTPSDSVSGTWSGYGYDALGNLVSYGSGSTSATYAYDGDGLRQSKTVNGTTTQFTWDVSGSLPTILEAGSTKYITGPDGLPTEQVDGSGNVLYYVQDQLGSTRGLLDSSGNIAASFTYSPYGQLTASTGTATTPFGFGGQYTDSESGLQYLRSRYYDPASEQFMTRDPLEDVTGTPYAYVYGDPLNALDPLGLGCSVLGLSMPFGSSGSCIKHAWNHVTSTANGLGTASWNLVTGVAGGIWSALNRPPADFNPCWYQNLFGGGVGSAGDPFDKTAAAGIQNMDARAIARSMYNKMYGELKPDRIVDAWRNQFGKYIEWKYGPKAGRPIDHLTKVRQALRGLRSNIDSIQRLLKSSRISENDRQILSELIKQASKFADAVQSILDSPTGPLESAVPAPGVDAFNELPAPADLPDV